MMSAKKIVPVLLAVLLLLPGCKANRERDFRKTAEEYLSSLSEIAADTLTLEEGDAERYGDVYAFPARSGKYADTFLVYVSPDLSVTDTYFSLDLLDSAREVCTGLVSDALPDFGGTVSVGVERRFSSSALSKRIFDTIYAAQECVPAALLLEIGVEPAEDPFTEEELLPLLEAIRDSGLSASVTVSGFEAAYEVSEGCIYRLSGGADGGAYIKRHQLP